jgi:hypothetical protein
MVISTTMLMISVVMPSVISTRGRVILGVGVDGFGRGVSATFVVDRGVGVFGNGVGVVVG